MSRRRVGATLAVLALAAAAVLGVAALEGDGGVDEEEYVARNLRLLGELPVFPGAQATLGTSSGAYTRRDTPEAPVAGYYTTRRFALPTETSAAAVTRFYRTHMRGWRLDRGSESRRSLSFRRGNAYVHVLVYTPREYVVGVDHDCNGCPGP